MGLHAIEQRRPLREDQRLVALRDGLFERLEQTLDLRRRQGMLARNEAGVASRLTKAQERFESRENAAARGELLRDVPLGRHTDGVVDTSFGLVELDVEHRIGARRQLRQNLFLRAAQHERANLGAQARRRIGVAADDGSRVSRLKVACAAQQAGIREMHRAPKLLQSILHRRSAEEGLETCPVARTPPAPSGCPDS